jgi:hypothetical protein
VLFCFQASLTKLLCHLLAHEHFKCARMLRVHISVWIYRDTSRHFRIMILQLQLETCFNKIDNCLSFYGLSFSILISTFSK